MRLKARGWRGREIDIDLPRIAVLSGPTGSGKTNVLEAAEFALSGSVARRGTSATGCLDVTADGAEAWLGPWGHRISHTAKTAKAERLGEAADLRPLFIDLGAFLDGTDRERAQMMEGLVAYDATKALEAGREAAQRELNSAGVDDVALSTLERLDVEISAAAELHKRMKATMETLLAAKSETTDDPEELALQVADIQGQLANYEAMDRDARIQQDQIARAKAELERLADWNPEELAAYAPPEEPGPKPELPAELELSLEILRSKGRAAAAEQKGVEDGVCPVLGTICEALKAKAADAAAKTAKLRERYRAVQAEAEAAKEKHAADLAAWQDRSAAFEAWKARQARWGDDPGKRIAELQEHIAGLTAARVDRDVMNALKAQLDGLTIRLERARQAKANIATLRTLAPGKAEAKASALRKAKKAWQAAQAKTLADGIEPIESKLTKALGVAVRLNPEQGWRATVGDRAATSLSGGQRIHFWAALMTAIARPEDVLLCEGAEADGVRIEAVVEQLQGCPAQQIIITTHWPVDGAITHDVYGGTR